MADLKSFAVFGEAGRIGTLAAPARFLDPRTEKTVQLDKGGEIVVPANALTVQPDGSFFLRGYPPEEEMERTMQVDAVPQPGNSTPATMDKNVSGKNPLDKLYREGYSIERVKVDRVITEPVSQRQEGDTLILPVVEEVWVMEKRTMLREEIRITRNREEVTEVKTVEGVR